MNITSLPVGPFKANCYIAAAPDGNAIVIDPGAEEERIASVLLRNRLAVASYLLTHGHVDHIGALRALWKRFPAPIAIHRADERWAFGPHNVLPPYYADAPARPESIERLLEGGEKFADGGLRWEAIAAPGHSPGGVCFYFPGEGALFSGDILFRDSVGRSDLTGGNPRLLGRSLKVIAGLPRDTAVYPGHGPETTVGRELEFNPFL